jgi:hypothetical protein
MKHIISYSGGIGSFMAAKRVVEQYGKENVLLVFTDTRMEDPDLYRFIDDTVKYLGAEYLCIQEGRDVWEVFFDSKYMGNSRFCGGAKTLKQDPFREWLESNYEPDECIVYLGMDWSEEHRHTRAIPHWLPYTVKSPMCEEPFLSKIDMLDVLREIDIAIPSLYNMGFNHNNCGGFCVKAGHKHFLKLLEKMPERYKYHEEKEQEFRIKFDKDVSILKNRIGGKTKPLTLKELRERVENKNFEQLDLFDEGGCGCFVDVDVNKAEWAN